MDARLRNWAVTGRYVDDGAISPDRDHELRPRPAGWNTTPLLAFLVPVGILCGALLAIACVARLLALPFTRRRSSR